MDRAFTLLAIGGTIVRTHFLFAKPPVPGETELMQLSEETSVDDVLSEITALLATAYQRRARIRLIRPVAGPVPSTEDLDKTTEPSPHELTLTRRRKESERS